MREIVCSFFGHREIRETEALKSQVRAIIEELIEKENVNTFLFGSKSRFNDLCYELVTEAKEKTDHHYNEDRGRFSFLTIAR